MKKILLLITLITSISSYSYYQSHAVCSAHGIKGQCSVYNNSFYPVYCSGDVRGLTYYGNFLFTQMNHWVNPGSYSTVYIYSNIYNPFINVQSSIFCR